VPDRGVGPAYLAVALTVASCTSTTSREPAAAANESVASAPSPSASAAPQPRSPSHQEIQGWIRRMGERYKSCQTYQDLGVLHSKLEREDDSTPTLSKAVFRTAHDRQTGGFSFEFVEIHARYFDPEHLLVWRDDSQRVRSWKAREPTVVDEGTDLTGALSSWSGISSYASWLVPRMLLTDCCGKGELPYRFVGREPVGGNEAVHLELQQDEMTIEVWIRVADGALLRFAERDVIRPAGTNPILERFRDRLPPDFGLSLLHTEQTIEYQPVVDESISPHHFRPSPPNWGSSSSDAIESDR
jgi:hypothetical protein